jgi:hypothetical protein
MMKKKRFKIIRINTGENPVYDTKIKTWFGWTSFSVFYKTYLLHVYSEPTDQKDQAYERIYEYCKARGYKREDIVITEKE